MRSTRLVKVAGKSIIKNKMRTLLTMLGIIIGVGAVIVMVAVGEGAQSQIEEQIQNLGTNMLVITPGSSSAGGVSQGASSFNRLKAEDAEKIKNESAFVAGVSPVIFTRTQIVGGNGNWRSTIHGVSTDYPVIRDWDLTSGRFFDASEQRLGKKVMVLGATIAENLFPDEDPVGQRVLVRNVPVVIIGVLEKKGQTPDGNDQDDVALAPFLTVQRRLSNFTFVRQILANTYSPDDIDEAQVELRAIMREAHGLASWESDDFEVKNQDQLSEAAQGTTEVMTMLLAAIASISLLVGGIGIMNIMLVSVTERTREIGIRMAIGARGSDVLTQFLIESIVMSILGGAIGVAIGFGGARLLATFTGWNTVVSPDTIFVAIAFSAAVGIFFGFYPARKAAALNPIDALRFE
ncbi:MAG: FtsX-like permease family protein [Bacteroidetes Order II. Incertae sedis bacterium]|nr:FtsX-like permease family protein [Bacteroidetes Order II. bacterium]MDG1753439.1 ABC transporter permease [Rhodothermales bacterium]MBT4602616.1 FtsX-like permease family protein [Bacteroidetes Order II. bacterium]MBT5249000.1 FtsX-like permease family protein [Bacteroidetes Order II. bacterium]MBT6201077.1 FtsX-like permease family protein [Bacteroidetes Order II. bacterium]